MSQSFNADAAVTAYLGDEPLGNAAQFGVATAVGTNPELEAELQSVAKRTGVPIDSVRAYPEDVKRQDVVAGINFDEMARTSPATTRLLSDAEKAKIAHDDIDNLRGIEDAFVKAEGQGRAVRGQIGAPFRAPNEDRRLAFGSVGETYRRPARVVGEERTTLQGITEPFVRGFGRFEQAVALAVDPVLSPAREVEARARAAHNIPQSTPNVGLAVLLKDIERKRASPLPEDVQAGLQEIGRADTLLGGVGAVLRNPLATKEVILESLGVTAPVLATAATLAPLGPLGAAAGAGLGSFGTEYYNTVLDVVREKAVNQHDPVAIAAMLSDPEIMASAREKGFKRGISIALFDALSAGLAGRLLAGAKGTVGSVAARSAGEASMQAGFGGAGEAAAQGLTGEYKPGEIVLEALAEMPTALIEVPANYTEARAKAVKAEANAKVVERMDKAVKASKLRTRDVDTFEAFVAEAAKDGPVSEVYIDAKVLMQSGVAEQVLEASPTAAAQMGEALATGGDVRIPVAEYTARVAGTDMNTPLMEHIRFNPEDMSQAEAQVFMQNAGPELEAAVERTIATAQQRQERTREVESVVEKVREQLDATGRHTPAVAKAQSSLVGAFYNVTASKLGVSPTELFEQKPLTVVAQRSAGRQFAQEAAGVPEQTAAKLGGESLPGLGAPDTVAQGGKAPKGTFAPATNTITLLETADLSTFLHEAGHAFLQMQFDIAAQVAAKQASGEALTEGEQGLLRDTSVLLNHYQVESLAQWNNMTFEQQTLVHEDFARSFEAYLFEGKAPSVELQSIFQQFAAWLKQVYQSIKRLGVDLTPEVRGVMDRMLATEEEIELAEQARSLMPLFLKPEDAVGATTEEFAAYQALNTDASREAMQELRARTLRDMAYLQNAKGRVVKKLQKQAEGLRKEARIEARAEVLSKPVYAAWQFLNNKLDAQPTTDEAGVATPAAGAGRLDITLLEGMGLPDGIVAALKARKMTAKAGMPPGVVADLFGFQSAEEMLNELATITPTKEAIENLTDLIMLERHGDVSSPEAIDNAADKAVFNDVRAKFIATEMRILDKATGRKSILSKAAKEFAAGVIGRQKVKDIKPSVYTAAETRAAKAATKASKAGDMLTAAAEKRNQLIAVYANRAAHDAQEDIIRIVKHFKQLSRKGSQSAMRGDYLVQLNALLGRFDFRAKTMEDRKPLAAWVEDEAERLSAVAPELPEWVLDEAYVKSYKDMTVDEVRGLDTAVRQLEHMARREEKMYQAVRNQNYQQEVAGVLGEFEQVHPEAFDGGAPIPYRKDELPLIKEFAGRFASKFDANFINMENMLDAMTQGKGRKVFESLFGRLSKAQDERTAYMKRLSKVINEATDAYSVKEKLDMAFTKSKVPGTNLYLTREQRIAVALNNGSAEGRQRLLGGNGYDQATVQKIVDSLDAKDVALVKALWELSEKNIWPELAAVNERTTGIAPKKVEAAPFTHATLGEMPGGYVPLVYDGDMDARALNINEGEAVKDMLGGMFGGSATKRSASKERVETVNRPLDLSIRAMAFKLNETVHDITHREAVADTARLLQTKSIADVVRRVAGPDVYKSMLAHLNEVAAKPRTPTGFTEKVFWHLRKNTLVAMMGASVNTITVNILGAVPVMRRVGPARFVKHLGRFVTPQGLELYRYVLDKSLYMRERLSSFDRDMNEELNRLRPGSVMPSMGFWFAGLSAMDRAITMPAWLAAYEKGMEKFKNDEQAAVDYADRLIRQTQGSGRAVDLASIAGGVGPAGEFKRIVTMFMNFFTAQLGSLRAEGSQVSGLASEGQYAKAAIQATSALLAVVVIPATLEALARGSCGEGDDLLERVGSLIADPEELLYCSARSSALFAAGFFPVFRDVLPYVWRQFDPDFQGGFGVRLSPVETALETMARMPRAAADVAQGEETQADINTLLRGFGFLVGLPGFQAARTVEAYKELSTGESEDITDLLTGPPKDKR